MLLVVRPAPKAGLERPQLVSLLGAERCRRVEELLIARAAAWAAEVALAGLHIACEPGEVEASVRRLLGPEVPLLASAHPGESERLLDAVEQVTAGDERPVLVIWPELPLWRGDHAGAALEDLADGCDVSVGPVFDGGFYLLALARPLPALLTLPDRAWHGPEAMGLVLTAAHEAGLTAGLLRAERGLRTEADVRAALADPLLDPELARVLGRG